jgi:hypothetical protein
VGRLRELRRGSDSSVFAKEGLEGAGLVTHGRSPSGLSVGG